MSRAVVIVSYEPSGIESKKVALSLQRHGINIDYLSLYNRPKYDLNPYIREWEERKCLILLVLPANIEENSMFLQNFQEMKKNHLECFLCPTTNGFLSQIPPQLYWEHFLPLDNSDSYRNSINYLLELIKPEVLRRRELLQRIKKPSNIDEYTFQELRLYLNEECA